MSVVRFGVSIEKELLEALDEYVIENRYSNRSQAIRQLISNNLTIKKWKCNNIVAGSVTLVYSHEKSDIPVIYNMITTGSYYHLSIFILIMTTALK
jgi:CopG family nickel-responsive transcriptional regulator